MTQLLKQSLKLALVQLASGADKALNLTAARTKVLEAASAGAKLVVLPECFNSPYGTKYFDKYAETLLPSPPTADQAPSYHALSSMAKDNAVFLVGGSIPEFNPDTGKHHNTSLIFGPDGALLASHRKVHLFGDVDRAAFSAGDQLVSTVRFRGLTIAMLICYDVEFPEWTRMAGLGGADVLAVPTNWPLEARPERERPMEVVRLQAAASANRMFVVAADRCGSL